MKNYGSFYTQLTILNTYWYTTQFYLWKKAVCIRINNVIQKTEGSTIRKIEPRLDWRDERQQMIKHRNSIWSNNRMEETNQIEKKAHLTQPGWKAETLLDLRWRETPFGSIKRNTFWIDEEKHLLNRWRETPFESMKRNTFWIKDLINSHYKFSKKQQRNTTNLQNDNLSNVILPTMSQGV